MDPLTLIGVITGVGGTILNGLPMIALVGGGIMLMTGHGDDLGEWGKSALGGVADMLDSILGENNGISKALRGFIGEVTEEDMVVGMHGKEVGEANVQRNENTKTANQALKESKEAIFADDSFYGFFSGDVSYRDPISGKAQVKKDAETVGQKMVDKGFYVEGKTKEESKEIFSQMYIDAGPDSNGFSGFINDARASIGTKFSGEDNARKKTIENFNKAVLEDDTIKYDLDQASRNQDLKDIINATTTANDELINSEENKKTVIARLREKNIYKLNEDGTRVEVSDEELSDIIDAIGKKEGNGALIPMEEISHILNVDDYNKALMEARTASLKESLEAAGIHIESEKISEPDPTIEDPAEEAPAEVAEGDAIPAEPAEGEETSAEAPEGNEAPADSTKDMAEPQEENTAPSDPPIEEAVSDETPGEDTPSAEQTEEAESPVEAPEEDEPIAGSAEDSGQSLEEDIAPSELSNEKETSAEAPIRDDVPDEPTEKTEAPAETLEEDAPPAGTEEDVGLYEIESATAQATHTQAGTNNVVNEVVVETAIEKDQPTHNVTDTQEDTVPAETSKNKESANNKDEQTTEEKSKSQTIIQKSEEKSESVDTRSGKEIESVKSRIVQTQADTKNVVKEDVIESVIEKENPKGKNQEKTDDKKKGAASLKDLAGNASPDTSKKAGHHIGKDTAGSVNNLIGDTTKLAWNKSIEIGIDVAKKQLAYGDPGNTEMR